PLAGTSGPFPESAAHPDGGDGEALHRGEMPTGAGRDDEERAGRSGERHGHRPGRGLAAGRPAAGRADDRRRRRRAHLHSDVLVDPGDPAAHPDGGHHRCAVGRCGHAEAGVVGADDLPGGVGARTPSHEVDDRRRRRPAGAALDGKADADVGAGPVVADRGRRVDIGVAQPPGEGHGGLAGVEMPGFVAAGGGAAPPAVDGGGGVEREQRLVRTEGGGRRRCGRHRRRDRDGRRGRRRCRPGRRGRRGGGRGCGAPPPAAGQRHAPQQRCDQPDRRPRAHGLPPLTIIGLHDRRPALGREGSTGPSSAADGHPLRSPTPLPAGRPRPQDRGMRRSVMALTAVALVMGAAAGILVVAGRGRRPLVVSSETTTTTAATTTTTAATTATTATAPSTGPTTTAPAPPAGLRTGATGPEVTRLQQRLAGLGFWLGAADGVFSAVTAHAVVAFQKLAGLPPDGIVGPDTSAALVADGGAATAVLDVSTGRVAGTTPTGRFTVTRQVDGYDHSPLGVLYRPKYFYRGVAVHGYPSVPPTPASHGCVRTIDAAMDWLWSSGAAPIGTAVWVYRA